jgi:multisubunit Na+/H+ antiporter MnhF subunit
LAVLTIKTLRNFMPLLSASTPSVICLIVLVTAVWPEPHPVIVVAIIISAVNFLKVLAMAKGYP